MRRSKPEDFWKRVDVRGPDECWPWTGPLDDKGYGRLCYQGRNWRSNRLAWELTNGPAQDDVLHTCDNRPCCNPDHLFEGTHQQNMADRNSKQRQARGERVNTAKLTKRKVRTVRAFHRAGLFTLAELSEIYSVTPQYAGRLTKKQTWKHVTD